MQEIMLHLQYNRRATFCGIESVIVGFSVLSHAYFLHRVGWA